MNKVLGTRKKNHQCPHCSYTCKSSSNLKRHVRMHTGEKPFTCGKCKRSFAAVCDLNRHLLTHTGEKPYKCSVCYKSFNQSASLTTHMGIHLGKKSYKCDICKRRFTQFHSLWRHVRNHTSKEPMESVSARKVDKRYFCQRCGLTFKGPTFKCHRCIPNPVQPHVPMPSECPVGGNRAIGNMHMPMHEEYKPYECMICSLVFATESHWLKHVVEVNCIPPITTEGSNVDGGSR